MLAGRTGSRPQNELNTGFFAMYRPLGALIVAAGALSACAPLEQLKQDLLAPEAEATQPVGTESVSEAPAGAVQKLPPLPARKPALALDAPDPAKLVGLDFAAAKALLGEPIEQHEEPPARVWAYDGRICLLNVFFYPSVEDNVFRVLTYEVEDNGDAPADGAEKQPSEARASRCLAEVLQARHADTG